MRYIKIVKKISLAAAFGLLVLFVAPSSSSALSGSEFNAGRIIDDSVFFNSNSMSVAEIQNFLSSKVDCDFDGSEMVGSITRAQYAANRGYPTTFTCLPQYKENVSTKVNNLGNPFGVPDGAISAAQIIYNVSAEHGVSSKALIVLLQKEQALVTDEWPVPRQYQIATGYGCPDTAPCDEQYYGFYNQVNKAAYQFKRYVNNSPAYRYKSGQVNSIYWSPNTSCGASNVYIENGATAALYNYTPYRPNQAALNNLYGTGDGCSAYGNRNFWRMFRDWFGATTANLPAYDWDISSVSIYSDPDFLVRRVNNNATPGEYLYVRAEVINTGYRSWPASSVRIGTSDPRDSTGIFYDSSTWISVNRPSSLDLDSVQYGETSSFVFRIKMPNSQGSFTERYSFVHEGSGWSSGTEKLEISLNVKSPSIASEMTTVLSETTDADMSIGDHKLLLGGSAAIYLDRASGNLILFSRHRELWRSSNAGNPGARLVMQSDGNLVIYNASNSPVWNTGTMGNPGSFIRLQPDMNLVLRSRYANISDGVKWSIYR